jgi:hypothetical protein
MTTFRCQALVGPERALPLALVVIDHSARAQGAVL